MRSRTKNAFTLIELLVVIAIISILAAILFPVFAEAKNSARITVCVSNFKQMGAAFHLYLADNDDMWPAAVSPVNAGPSFSPQQPWVGFDNNNIPAGGGWYGSMIDPARNPVRPGALDPYIKNQGVKECPSRPAKWQMAMAYNWFCGHYKSGNSLIPCSSSYHSVNPKARGNEFGPGTKVQDLSYGFAVSLAASNSEVERTAETIAVWEHGHRAPVCNFLFSPNWFNSPPNSQVYRDHFNFLHREGTTTLWTDSHVRRMSYQQLKRPMFSCIKSIYE